ncbi:MAG: hypothetical protein M1834_009284 [Cirrosporium novae-zelandiae]|nr:MAG: hypothetical protein M1834_009284 [Cirrosporium novae-zelandiae]
MSSTLYSQSTTSKHSELELLNAALVAGDSEDDDDDVLLVDLDVEINKESDNESGDFNNETSIYVLTNEEEEGEAEAEDNDDDDDEEGDFYAVKTDNGTQLNVKGMLPPKRSVSRKLGDLYEGLLNTPYLVLDPDYQRDVVWPTSKMSELIKSLFRDFAVPPIILSKRKIGLRGGEREHFVCVDGKQRLTSIREFMRGKLAITDQHNDEWYYKQPLRPKVDKRGNPCYDQNGNVIFIAIKDVKVIGSALKRRFDETELICFEYDGLTEGQERRLFKKVQEGMPLNAMEKFAAVDGSWQKFIRRLINEFPNVATLTSHNRSNDFGNFIYTCFQIMECEGSRRAKPTYITQMAQLQKRVEDMNLTRDLEKKFYDIFLIYSVLADYYPRTFGAENGRRSNVFSPADFALTAVLISAAAPGICSSGTFVKPDGTYNSNPATNASFEALSNNIKKFLRELWRKDFDWRKSPKSFGVRVWPLLRQMIENATQHNKDARKNTSSRKRRSRRFIVSDDSDFGEPALDSDHEISEPSPKRQRHHRDFRDEDDDDYRSHPKSQSYGLKPTRFNSHVTPQTTADVARISLSSTPFSERPDTKKKAVPTVSTPQAPSLGMAPTNRENTLATSISTFKPTHSRRSANPEKPSIHQASNNLSTTQKTKKSTSTLIEPEDPPVTFTSTIKSTPFENTTDSGKAITPQSSTVRHLSPQGAANTGKPLTTPVPTSQCPTPQNAATSKQSIAPPTSTTKPLQKTIHVETRTAPPVPASQVPYPKRAAEPRRAFNGYTPLPPYSTAPTTLEAAFSAAINAFQKPPPPVRVLSSNASSHISRSPPAAGINIDACSEQGSVPASFSANPRPPQYTTSYPPEAQRPASVPRSTTGFARVSTPNPISRISSEAAPILRSISEPLSTPMLIPNPGQHVLPVVKTIAPLSNPIIDQTPNPNRQESVSVSLQTPEDGGNTLNRPKEHKVDYPMSRQETNSVPNPNLNPPLDPATELASNPSDTRQHVLEPKSQPNPALNESVDIEPTIEDEMMESDSDDGFKEVIPLLDWFNKAKKKK